MKAKVVWNNGMAFAAELDGFHFLIDADKTVGGQGQGPRPKGLTLVSLAGCTGMDVISILQKMRLDVKGFEVETDAIIADEHPKKIKSIVIRYMFRGTNLSLEKIEKAIALSQEKYCGVSATLRPGVEIQSEIFINGKKIQP